MPNKRGHLGSLCGHLCPCHLPGSCPSVPSATNSIGVKPCMAETDAGEGARGRGGSRGRGREWGMGPIPYRGWVWGEREQEWGWDGAQGWGTRVGRGREWTLGVGTGMEWGWDGDRDRCRRGRPRGKDSAGLREGCGERGRAGALRPVGAGWGRCVRREAVPRGGTGRRPSSTGCGVTAGLHRTGTADGTARGAQRPPPPRPPDGPRRQPLAAGRHRADDRGRFAG